MKFFILLCLASAVFANEDEALASRDKAKAKLALDELTYSKQEHLYDIGGYNAEDAETEGGYGNDVTDPCLDFVCRLGWECVVDRVNNEPFCDCAQSCPLPDESDDEIHRVHVCSTTNATYANLCEFHRQKCMDDALNGVHIDYYGECTEIAACQQEDIHDYPTRMTQWFVESLMYLEDRPEENGGLTEKEKEVLREPRKPEAQAIFWKFRRLDKNPADLYLDFVELEPLRAPISLMEPCTQPFLNACDADNDSLISVLEFGRCLNLDERDMEY